METNWAAEHLQAIRTLMERSALYRRALAPIATFVGSVGILAAVAGVCFDVKLGGTFVLYWVAVGLLAIVGALFLVRRQALKDGESFWSPPTRRVAQALIPALLVGLFFGVFTSWFTELAPMASLVVVIPWTLLYGLALHAASFFISRGFRTFSWGFLVAGLALAGYFISRPENYGHLSPHVLMGVIFGGSHLAYGIYLYFTERKNEA